MADQVSSGLREPVSAWAAVSRRQRAAHPLRSRASRVTRGADSSTNAPPRTGDRRTAVPEAVPRLGAGVCSNTATAKSAPKTGRTACWRHAFANLTAPDTVSRSVSASAPMPRSAARPTRASGWEAPKRTE